ncbi:MAG: hypothetical protein WAW36_00775 [Methylovulum miyakonense]|uniref:hypothetical protein n=1 Tax=Methylovulum miyakonense TaxID=645578 RepID=UPI003BB773BC
MALPKTPGQQTARNEGDDKNLCRTNNLQRRQAAHATTPNNTQNRDGDGTANKPQNSGITFNPTHSETKQGQTENR